MAATWIFRGDERDDAAAATRAFDRDRAATRAFDRDRAATRTFGRDRAATRTFDRDRRAPQVQTFFDLPVDAMALSAPRIGGKGKGPWSTEALGVVDGHYYIQDAAPVPGEAVKITMAFLLKRFGGKSPKPCRIKRDFVLLLELLVGHRETVGCDGRQVALVLLSNSDYLHKSENATARLSILQLLVHAPAPAAAAVGKQLPRYETLLAEAAAARDTSVGGFLDKLKGAAGSALKQGQAAAAGEKTSKHAEAANEALLRKLHDALKKHVKPPTAPPLPPRAPVDTAVAFHAPSRPLVRASPAAATPADRQKYAFKDGFADVLDPTAVGPALRESHVRDARAPAFQPLQDPFDLKRADLNSKMTARKTLERLASDLKFAAEARRAKTTEPTLGFLASNAARGSAQLVDDLTKAASVDANGVAAAIDQVLELANATDSNRAAVARRLARTAPEIDFARCVRALLSTTGEADLKGFNPGCDPNAVLDATATAAVLFGRLVARRFAAGKAEALSKAVRRGNATDVALAADAAVSALVARRETLERSPAEVTFDPR